jgi:hypothetical protein
VAALSPFLASHTFALALSAFLSLSCSLFWDGHTVDGRSLRIASSIFIFFRLCDDSIFGPLLNEAWARQENVYGVERPTSRKGLLKKISKHLFFSSTHNDNAY